MRDPNRIYRITAQLATLWQHHPDLRLGQLLTIAASKMHCDLFYVEDEDIISALQGFIDETKEGRKD